MDFIGSRLLFYVDEVRVLMHDLLTNVKESRHMVLNKIAAALFSSYLKRSIEVAVEKLIREKMKEITIDTSLPLSEQLPLSM